MEPVYTMEDLSQVRALSHPLRIEIVKKLGEEALSVGEVAQRLGQAPSKLHYHVGELEEAGLVTVVDRRRKGHLLEKVYRAAGRSITVDRSIFARDPEGMEAWYAVVASVLDSALIDLRRVIEGGRIDPDVAERAVSLQDTVSVSPERYEEFRGRLRALISDFADLDRGDDAGHRAALTVLLYPSQNTRGEANKEPKG